MTDDGLRKTAVFVALAVAMFVVLVTYVGVTSLRRDCFKVLENPTVPLEVKIKLMEGHCK